MSTDIQQLLKDADSMARPNIPSVLHAIYGEWFYTRRGTMRAMIAAYEAGRMAAGRSSVTLTVQQINELAKYVQVDGKEMRGCSYEPDDEVVVNQYPAPQPIFDEDCAVSSHHRLVAQFIELSDEGSWPLDDPQEEGE